jgi:RimJ/RimL family protein N-acetyltransferase
LVQQPAIHEVVTLRDGTVATIRPIRPDDAPRLQAGFARLSQESIFFRFLSYMTRLADDEAYRLAHVDYDDQMALVASIQAGGDEQLIGVARYATLPAPGDDTAELAIVVGDEYQGRGLGTLLLERLIAYAQAHGVRKIVGSVHQSNLKMLQILRTKLRYEVSETYMGKGEIQVTVDISRPRADAPERKGRRRRSGHARRKSRGGQ